MLAIWSLVLLPFPKPACTSGISWFMRCWSLAWRILSITLQTHEMSAIVWWFEHSLALPLELEWKLTFSRWEMNYYLIEEPLHVTHLVLLLLFTAFWDSFFGFLIKMCLIVDYFMLVLLGIHWTFGHVDPFLLSHLGSVQPLFIQVFFLTLSLISF